MADTPDRQRRRQLRDACKNAERAARTALMPIGERDLEARVAYVDVHVVRDGCDHTPRHAERWALQHGVDWERLAEGLREFGGFCDCEVVMNCDPGDVFR